MQRTLLIALLMTLSAGSSLAQRGLVGLPANGGPAGCCPGAHFPHPHGFPAHGNLILPFYPLWYEYNTTSTNTSIPGPSAPVQTQPRPLQPWPVTPKAQVIEVPQTKEATAAKPRVSSVFVLKDGSRIYTERYLLTTDCLRAQLGRQERRVPFDAIDLDATAIANRERGIALRIPASPGEMALGF